MKKPAANDNGKPEDYLAAAMVALHKAMEGLDAPAEILVDVLKVEPDRHLGATLR